MKKLNLDHFYRLSDSTGILQYSQNGVPDRSGGYSTSDNARALLVAAMLYERSQDKAFLELLYRYLSFLLHAQIADGRFQVFMSYERRFQEKEGSQDCLGVCLWALGYLLGTKTIPSGVKITCRQMMERALPRLQALVYPRAKAYAVIGLSYAGKEMDMPTHLCGLADSLVQQFKLYSYGGWNWFEDVIAHNTGVLPWSLFRAYRVMRSPDYLKTALDSLEFLTEHTFRLTADQKRAYYKPIGTRGWMTREAKPAEFDEKPLEAAETAMAFLEAFRLFKEKKYLERAQLCLSWFEGINSQNLAMIDKETQGCYDAITPQGVNPDQGAESLLSYLLANLSLDGLLNINK